MFTNDTLTQDRIILDTNSLRVKPHLSSFVRFWREQPLACSSAFRRKEPAEAGTTNQ